jgi:hypothetical protein
MGSTEPRIVMRINAGGDGNYSVFTPHDAEAREMLCDEGVAFADGDAVWVLEPGNHADYVLTQLVMTGVEVLDHPDQRLH